MWIRINSDRGLPLAVYLFWRGVDHNSGRWLQWHWKGRMRRVKRVMTVKFWPGFTIACVRCTAPKAARR